VRDARRLGWEAVPLGSRCMARGRGSRLRPDLVAEVRSAVLELLGESAPKGRTLSEIRLAMAPRAAESYTDAAVAGLLDEGVILFQSETVYNDAVHDRYTQRIPSTARVFYLAAAKRR
jgi:hypothetical protein